MWNRGTPENQSDSIYFVEFYMVWQFVCIIFFWYLGFGYMACQLQRDLFGQHLAHQPRLSCQKCSPLASRTPRAVYRAPTAKGRRSMGTMGTGSVKGSISEFWCFCCRSYGLRGCRNWSFCFSGNMKQPKKT